MRSTILGLVVLAATAGVALAEEGNGGYQEAIKTYGECLQIQAVVAASGGKAINATELNAFFEKHCGKFEREAQDELVRALLNKIRLDTFRYNKAAMADVLRLELDAAIIFPHGKFRLDYARGLVSHAKSDKSNN